MCRELEVRSCAKQATRRSRSPSCMPPGSRPPPPSFRSLSRTDTSCSASVSTAGWSACACSSQNLRPHPRRPAGAGHTDRQPRYSSRSPRIAPARVSVSAASIVVALSGAVRLAGLRSRACRCSRGHRPSGCDTEARGRRATLPQRHRRGVGGSLTRTPLRHAYRLQRPCSSSDRSWLLWERVAPVGLHHFARVRKLAQRRADRARLDAGFVCDLRGGLGAAV